MKQVGEYTGTHAQSIWRYEMGKFDITVTWLERFAGLYGVSMASLIDPRNALPAGLTRESATPPKEEDAEGDAAA